MKKCQLVTFQSCKGGAGATTLSLAFSQLMAKESEYSVLWLQYNPCPDGRAWFSGQKDWNGFSQLIDLAVRGTISSNVVKKVVHKQGDLHVMIAGPEELVRLKDLSDPDRLWKALRERFSLIVVDIATGLNEVALPEIDKRITVLSFDPAGLEAYRMYCQVRSHDHMPIVNHLPKQKKVDEYLKHVLKEKEYLTVPQDSTTAWNMLMQSQPIIQFPKSKLKQAINQFPKELMYVYGTESARGSHSQNPGFATGA